MRLEEHAYLTTACASCVCSRFALPNSKVISYYCIEIGNIRDREEDIEIPVGRLVRSVPCERRRARFPKPQIYPSILIVIAPSPSDATASSTDREDVSSRSRSTPSASLSYLTSGSLIKFGFFSRGAEPRSHRRRRCCAEDKHPSVRQSVGPAAAAGGRRSCF